MTRAPGPGKGRRPGTEVAGECLPSRTALDVQCFGRSNFTGTFNLNIWGPQVNLQGNSSGSANHRRTAGWHFDAPTIRFRFTVTPYDDKDYEVNAGAGPTRSFRLIGGTRC